MFKPIGGGMLVAVVGIAMLWPAHAGAQSKKKASATRPPNIVLVMTDDQGYGDVAAHGNSMIRTPNLDRLHGMSVRLTDFHVDPTCSPTRAALLTGRYSSRTGVWHTVMGRSIIRGDETTLAQLLRDGGYRTGLFGKWHLGENYPSRPQDMGFEEVVMHGGGGVGQTPDYWLNDYFDDHYMHNGRWKKYTGYCTDVFFDEALRFIKTPDDRPFFAYIPTNAPHGPFLVDERYAKPYRDAGVPQPMAEFYGMITNIDDNMGRLMAALKSSGLEDNTILIFTTDNGTAAGIWRAPGAGKGKAKGKSDAPPAPQPAWTGFNAGMRNGKGSQYDGGHRVPFFIRWPAGEIGGGRDVDQLTAHIDLLPTLLELVGLPVPTRLQIDGISLVPLLRGAAPDWPQRTITVHSQRIETPEKWRSSAVMTSRWRLIDGKELYDIKADPGQQSDLAAQHPDIVAKLRQEYERWWASISTRFDEYVPIVIGSPHDDPAMLTAMDWHTEMSQIPWNQTMIANDPIANGVWIVQVDRDGRYEFMLRQRPTEARHPITAATARLRIGDIEQTREVLPKDTTGLPFTVELKRGQYPLATWFIDQQGVERGAYYLYVRYVGAAD